MVITTVKTVSWPGWDVRKLELKNPSESSGRARAKNHHPLYFCSLYSLVCSWMATIATDKRETPINLLNNIQPLSGKSRSSSWPLNSSYLITEDFRVLVWGSRLTGLTSQGALQSQLVFPNPGSSSQNEHKQGEDKRRAQLRAALEENLKAQSQVGQQSPQLIKRYPTKNIYSPSSN